MLLSLGVGVMKAQKQKRLAMLVLEDAAIHNNAGARGERMGGYCMGQATHPYGRGH